MDDTIEPRTEAEIKRDYEKPRIIDIRRNKRTGNLHGVLVSENGDLLICATLEYIAQALAERMP